MISDVALLTPQQEAYRYLRDRILSGELAGDARLNPSEIAASLGISRMPVREALRALHAEGLVVMRPHRAAHVRRLTATDVEDLFDIRTALEVLSVGPAVGGLTNDYLPELVAIMERMDRVRANPVEWLKRHDDFHDSITALGQRTRLREELVRVRLAVRPYLLMYMKVFDTIEMPGLEHSSLLDALASRDVARAEQAMRIHVANPGKGLVRFLRQRETQMWQRGSLATSHPPHTNQ